MMTEVVAALIWDKDKFMICQRPSNKARPLLWEFVGGKVEPCETKEQALIRECKEELDITLEVGEIFTEAVHQYPDITIRLTVFNAKIAGGVPKLIEHNDLKWITPDEIPQYEFCPADVGVLKRLMMNREVKIMPIHNKLVRDKIPDIIKKSEKTPHCRILSDEEYLTELDRKLNEECAEYQTDKSLEELADMLEVMYAIVQARGYSVEELERVRAEKAEKRGGFKEKIYLESVDD